LRSLVSWVKQQRRSAARETSRRTSIRAIAPAAQLTLTPEQKTAIFDAVQPAEAKVKAQNVPATVGAQVPPATELYFLPDRALAIAPEAKATKYTVAQNRVVLVDPTTMRVVDVIPP
jgi:hypothetical protein